MRSLFKFKSDKKAVLTTDQALEVDQSTSQTTQQLIEEKARLQAAIGSLNVGFIITDKDQKVISINGMAKRLFCLGPSFQPYPASVISNINYLNVRCTLEDISQVLEGILDLRSNIVSCIQSGQPVDLKEVEFNQRFFHFLISPVVVLEKQGLTTIGSTIFIDDITERKVLERSRDEFFSIASHELRTPLAAIRGNTALIKQYFWDKLPDDSIKEMVEDIHQSSIRLINIVNDFLDTSRLEQGRIQFKMARFSIAGLVSQVFDELGQQAKERGLYLKGEQSTFLVEADPDRLKQVLINIVGNAIKFTDQGGITISYQPDGLMLKIKVHDTGRGIPAENQKLLFRKFQQANNNLYTRDSTKGTGLGLYISKLLIEGMNGQVNLEHSGLNQGSTFTFSLKIASS